MGIAPTGTIFKTLTFDNVNSKNYGVYITGQAVYNAPKKAVEMVTIPGRNGAYALDKGHFENIEVTYPAGIFAETEEDFAQAISEFRNFLCSKEGYVRLTDDYNPDEYRLAVYKSGLDVTSAQLIAGEFDIVFDCKPQRYLTSGEELITIGQWGATQTASGTIATFEADSATAIKTLTADINPIQDLHGYDSPWVGGAGKNKFGWKDGTYAIGSSGRTLTVENGEATYKVPTAISSTTMVTEAVITSAVVNTSLSAGTYTFSLTSNISPSGLITNATLNFTNGTSVVNGNSFTLAETATILSITATFAQNYSAGTYTFKVQIEQGSTKTDYAPFANICPISGHDEVGVGVVGVNVFDETNADFATGIIKDDGTIGTNYTSYEYAQNYTMVSPSTTYCVKGTAWVSSVYNYIACYDINKTFISRIGLAADISSARTFTTPSNCYYIRPSRAKSTWTDYCINYPSTATTYTPYNGQIYTTSLGTTVYGGSDELVSGVGTSTLESVSLNGSSTPAFSEVSAQTTADGTKYVAFINVSSYATASEKAYSDSYKWVDAPLGNLHVGEFNTRGSYIRFVLADQSLDTLAKLNADLVNNPIQLVYTKKTADSFTTTPTQVQTLLGTNNIFADSGDVTVEYGHDPNILSNPTLFPSRPQLQVYGYGTINVGGSEIKVENVPIGEVQVATQTATGVVPISQTLDVTALENGDTFTVSKAEAHMDYSSASALSFGLLSAYVMTNCSAVLTWALEKSKEVLKFDIYSDDISFSKGTAQTKTFSVAGPIIANGGQVNITISCSIVYDGNSSLTYNITATTVTNTSQAKSAKGQDIFGVSSRPLSSTIYIDLDTGEAYNIISGTPISVNNAVSLPAELPTLPSGDTTITFDNTFTKVDIVPRWWKV